VRSAIVKGTVDTVDKHLGLRSLTPCGRLLLASKRPFLLTASLLHHVNNPNLTRMKAYRLPHAMHRLDKLTSGLVVCAKTRPAAALLAAHFSERRVKKEYVAIVMGGVEFIPVVEAPDIGTEDHEESATSASGASRLEEEAEWSYIDAPCDSKDAKTKWRSESSFMGPVFRMNVPGAGDDEEEEEEEEEGTSKYTSKKCRLRFHLLALRPETGRKHQLRLHCSESLGWPIVGDELYDKGDDISIALRRSGMFLHARGLELPHPVYTALPPEADDQQEEEPHDGTASLHHAADGTVTLRVLLPPPSHFSDLEKGAGRAINMQGLFRKEVEKKQRQVDKLVEKADKAGKTHPFSYPQVLTPDGVTICSFYNYGNCRIGSACHWDHEHCHKCRARDHRAANCPGA